VANLSLILAINFKKTKRMRMKILKRVALVAALAVFVYGCKKQPTPSPDASVTALHNYGLNAMTPDQWSSVPVFSSDLLENTAGKTTGLSAATLPPSFLLASPAVRNQGQIGSCTGFCGAECIEILNYYQRVASPVTSTSLTAATGLITATSTQFSGTALFGPSGALSPLFIYYVERCIINGQPVRQTMAQQW
jgi:hypothetical protein